MPNISLRIINRWERKSCMFKMPRFSKNNSRNKKFNKICIKILGKFFLCEKYLND